MTKTRTVTKSVAFSPNHWFLLPIPFHLPSITPLFSLYSLPFLSSEESEFFFF